MLSHESSHSNTTATPLQNFGDLPLLQSETHTNRQWTSIENINPDLVGQEVLVRARVCHLRACGKIVFLVLREGYCTIQAVLMKTGEGLVTVDMLAWAKKIPPESVVDVYAIVNAIQEEVMTCTQSQVELHVSKLYVVSRSKPVLPFDLEDACRPLLAEPYLTGHIEKHEKKETSQMCTIPLNMRLDNRVLDLRASTNQAIMKLQSGVCQLFREFLYQNKFMEIHTPKILITPTEGATNAFKLKYFETDAYLAQSPQIHKQMCVMSDFQRVFEVGPVFRAERAYRPEHLCEFTGLDLEMVIKESYHEVLDLVCELFEYIFEGLEKRFAYELEVIRAQFSSEPFKFKKPVPKLTFEEGCALLKEEGIEHDPLEGLSIDREATLGRIVREKYDTDFFILHRYPAKTKPFYTMLCQNNPEYTNSYGLFMRGREVITGAQRIHDPKLLTQRATECGINPETFKDYIEAFKYGVYPHGGCGFGLERVVMEFCKLGNIRMSSLFPRDPKRIAP